MAQIEKRQHPDGKITYRARIRIQGMPDTSVTFHTRTAAKEWAYKKESELKQTRYFPRDDGKNRTFGAFVDHYVEKFLPKNLKSYAKQTQLILWCRSKLGKYYLAHITPSMIAQLRDELLEEVTRRHTTRSPSTTNRYLAALSRAFTICIKELGWLKENPVLHISRPKENKGRERFLSLNEVTNLLDACRYSQSQHLYPIVLFALSTGARRGEILNLKWNDLDFQRATATFRDTKNGESRTISLTPQLIDCLHKKRGCGIVLSSYVFPSQDGKKAADIECAWDFAVKKANLTNFRFHDLRHTAASHLAMSGASPLEIAAILGHKTLAMVKRYSHFSNSATAQVLKRMNNLMFGSC